MTKPMVATGVALLGIATLGAPALAAAPEQRPVCSRARASVEPASGRVCAPVLHRVSDGLGAAAAAPGLGGTSLDTPALLGGAGVSAGQGLGGIASAAATQVALSGLQTWVSGSATFVLHETAAVMAETTTPRLTSTWFSAAYWKVAGLAAVLTLPFIFAAAIQALIRSDLTLLARSALGYLPLAMLAVAIAAPLTMLLLSASDELSAAVSSAAGQQSVNFLDQAVAPLGPAGAVSGSPFLVFLLGLFTVAGALILWIELLMREAAVYVIVLMLPLAFAAFVWPARRIWAIRSLEVLVALILSKFAIVAVLSLGGAALGQSVHTSFAGMLAGIVLLTLGAFTPWALLRLLPLSEIASGAAGALREQGGFGLRGLQQADAWAGEAQHWVALTAQMARGFAGTKAPGARSADSTESTASLVKDAGAAAGGRAADEGSVSVSEIRSDEPTPEPSEPRAADPPRRDEA